LVASFTTEGFKKENPKVYAAVVAGLQDAIDYIGANTRDAAILFKSRESFKGTVEELVQLMEGQTAGQLSYNSTPNSAERFATFMHKSGTLKHLPKSWNDLWFENVWDKPGA
jgi:NitT/TauT family transport system substrate-binding protein